MYFATKKLNHGTEDNQFFFPKFPRKLRMITLNVGGEIFVTSKETLSSGFFKALIDSEGEMQQTYFIDRDPTFFRWILNFLRGSKVVPTCRLEYEQLKFEADFYCIDIPPYNKYQGLEYELQKISSKQMQALTDSLLSFYNQPFLTHMDWLDNCVRHSENTADTILYNQVLMKLFYFLLHVDVSNCTFINFTTQKLPQQKKDQFEENSFMLTLQNRKYEPFQYLQSVIPWDKVNADKIIRLGCFEIKGLTKTMHNTKYDDDDPSGYKIWVKLKSEDLELHNFVDYIRAIQNHKIPLKDHVKLFRLLLCTRDVVAEKVASYTDEEPFLKNDNQYVNQLHFAYSCPGNAKCSYDQTEALRREKLRKREFIREMEQNRMWAEDNIIT